MKITPLAQAQPRPRVLAIGEFDGVHLGHREVIGNADSVLTFEPHPRAVVGPTGAPDLLTTLDQKATFLEDLGVAELVVATFDEPFSKISADEFTTAIVVERLAAETVRVGANFRFGRGATGTAETLQADHRFATQVAGILEIGDGPVSSSRIRDLLRSGAASEAARLLGHPHRMSGEVQRGAARGRELGYPTANIALTDGCVVPHLGIYACLANGHPAAASLGRRPMFEDDDTVLLEVFLLGFSGDLYGQRLEVDLLELIRDEESFESVDALKRQMAADCATAAEICASATNPGT